MTTNATTMTRANPLPRKTFALFRCLGTENDLKNTAKYGYFIYLCCVCIQSAVNNYDIKLLFHKPDLCNLQCMYKCRNGIRFVFAILLLLLLLNFTVVVCLFQAIIFSATSIHRVLFIFFWMEAVMLCCWSHYCRRMKFQRLKTIATRYFGWFW